MIKAIDVRARQKDLLILFLIRSKEFYVVMSHSFAQLTILSKKIQEYVPGICSFLRALTQQLVNRMESIDLRPLIQRFSTLHQECGRYAFWVEVNVFVLHYCTRDLYNYIVI